MTIAIAGVLLLLAVCSAHAAPVFQTTGDNQQIVTGILGLPVGDGLYNVSFTYGTLNDIYGTAPRTYDWDNIIGAQAANNAIAELISAYNSVNDRNITRAGDLNNNSDEYYIGFSDLLTDDASAVFGFKSSGPGWLAGNKLVNVSQSDKLVYADFTVVPVPAAVWLLGGGLIGLLGLRRKFKS